MTGSVSDEARERCVELFAELGKKIDRIAAYLRTQQCKANIAAEEAQRLQQRRRSAEQRVSDVKEMLSYFMRRRNRNDWKVSSTPFAFRRIHSLPSRSTTGSDHRTSFANREHPCIAC